MRLGALILTLLPLTVLAQSPTTNPSTDEIQALVKQLSNDNYQKRQAAQDQLVRFGAGARPFLEQLLKESNDPEARTRAEAALQQMDEDKSAGPSLITIHAKDAPVENVI